MGKRIREELRRLREIEHAVWHLLDDAGERCDLIAHLDDVAGSTILEVDKERLEALNDLLPEECPQGLRKEARRG